MSSHTRDSDVPVLDGILNNNQALTAGSYDDDDDDDEFIFT